MPGLGPGSARPDVRLPATSSSSGSERSAQPFPGDFGAAIHALSAEQQYEVARAGALEDATHGVVETVRLLERHVRGRELFDERVSFLRPHPIAVVDGLLARRDDERGHR